MAKKIFRIIPRVTSNLWISVDNFSVRANFRQTFASASQDQNFAFWDEEGSTVVDQKKLNEGLLKTGIEPTNKTHDTKSYEFVRNTKFGHVRLDSENKPLDIPQPKEPSVDFIDNQYFGNHVEKESPMKDNHDKKITTSVDVPLDTNQVDQQYFYPSQMPQNTTHFPSTVPLAAELKFNENEIDNQYFGVSEDELSQSKKRTTTRLNAIDYLRTKKNSDKAISMPASENIPEHWKKYSDMIPDFKKLPNEAICSILKKRIIYNKDGIVVMDKPYGLVVTDGREKSPIILTSFLPRLSEKLGVKKLHTVHRLDRDTTGILVLASDEKTAGRLHELFANREINKRYLAITKGIPNPREGTIDIPLCETVVFGRERMTVRPVLPHSEDSTLSFRYNTKTKSHHALTHYRVIRTSKSAAFVELNPETGVRHQLRVHLSEALNCPILGDHKYSHDDKYAPQKLPQDILDSLRINQSKARNIPMHLHATFVSIPGFGLDGALLEIRCPLSHFFRYTLKKLGLNSKP